MTRTTTPAAVSLRARMEPQPPNDPKRIVSYRDGSFGFYLDRPTGGPYLHLGVSPFGSPGSIHNGMEVISTSVEHTPEGWFWLAEAKAKEGT